MISIIRNEEKNCTEGNNEYTMEVDDFQADYCFVAGSNLPSMTAVLVVLLVRSILIFIFIEISIDFTLRFLLFVHLYFHHSNCSDGKLS